MCDTNPGALLLMVSIPQGVVEDDERGEDDLLPRLISESPVFRLAAGEDVAGQAFSTVETACGLPRGCSRLGAVQRGLEQWPATSDPMAVTSIHQFISPSREPSFGSILPGREPG